MRFTAYTDESYTTAQRYRSICAFSFPSEWMDIIKGRLDSILRSSDVAEFKWQKVKDAKYKFCACKLADAAIDLARECGARIDVLIWDTYDSRHNVVGRDDAANFGRMFFHLLGNCMKRRQKASIWEIHPDEQMGIDWRTVRDCLSAVGRKCEVIDYPLLGAFLTDPHYEILDFSEVKSHEHPACQVADLFAGLAAFSKARFESYGNWCRENDKQCRLPLFTQEKHSFTNREEYRFQTLKYFSDCCKKHELGVSLKAYDCLCTRDPKHPLNFWHYAPQHERDRAPQKPKGNN